MSQARFHLCDARFKGYSGPIGSGKSQALCQEAIRLPKSNPAVRERVQLVNSKLKNAAGEVHMRISPRCKELIKDLEQVTYKPESTVIDKEKDLKRTHLSDALGYLIWQECRSGVRFGEQTTRLL
jgi:hypothetical protein